jgi:hypothetical protein
MRLRFIGAALAVVMGPTACSAGETAPDVGSHAALPVTAVVQSGTVGTDVNGESVEVAGPSETHAVIPVTYAGALPTAVVLSSAGPVAVPLWRLFPSWLEMAPVAITVRHTSGLRSDGSYEPIEKGAFNAWVGYGPSDTPIWAQVWVRDHWLLLGGGQLKVSGPPAGSLPDPEKGWLPGTGRVERSTLAPTPIDAFAGRPGTVELAAEASVTRFFPLRPASDLSDPVVAQGKLALAEDGTLDDDNDVSEFDDAWCEVADGTSAIFPGGRGELEGRGHRLLLEIADPARGPDVAMSVITAPDELGGYAIIDGRCTRAKAGAN